MPGMMKLVRTETMPDELNVWPVIRHGVLQPRRELCDETDRVEFAYGAAYKRLMEVKQKYDPENLFRVNQNTRPR